MIRDVVVIGGGPAGSTFAALLMKHAPDLRVTVLEQSRFPRYHIGESTIPAANGVFRELEVYDDLLRADFVKKMGIVFVWGKDRTPWNADYLRLKEVPTSEGGGDVIDVTGQDFRGVLDRLGYLDTPVTAFNVERAEFDDLLLKQARKFGAEVREGTRATEIRRDAAGAICGVEWQDDTGQTGVIETPFVLDASGLQSLLSRGERIYDPDMNNFAVYGDLKDADWKVRFNGSKDRSTVFIAAVERGWIWYFPIRPNVMSVGAVTRRDHLKDRLRDIDLEAFWWEMLRSCPEVAGLIGHATLRTDILPDGQRVAASQDWSSWARSPVGKGWAAAGDAAIFVDPILSSGVTLAIQSGHRAAYTYLTARSRPELSAASLWDAYATYIRGEYGAFLQMARYWYGNNKAAPSWWWEAQQVVNRAGRLRLDDRQAFTMATAGFFPVPRAITTEVVGALVTHLSGATADILGAARDPGVPEPDELIHCGLETLTAFRLGFRTEPPAEGAPPELQVFHDLVPEGLDFAHRSAAAPHRIAPALAPIVDAMPRHDTVAGLVAAAPGLLPAGHATEAAIRGATLELVKIAAMKGFVRLTPAPCPNL